MEIKVSERFKGNKDQDKSNVSLDDSDVQMIEDKNEPIVIDDSTIKIDKDLDCQITDLLSSIREEEEKALENTGDNPEENENIGEKSEENDNSGEKTEENKQKDSKAQNGVETAEEPKITEETEDKADEANANGENKDVEELKNDAKLTGKGTPTRASTRLANSTPSTIRTRRASKLGQN